MTTTTLNVTTTEGLHTRPANQFVRLVKEFACSVTISKGERSAPGTSLLKIMKLGVVQGDEVTITCDGTDEEVALQRVVAFLTNEQAAS